MSPTKTVDLLCTFWFSPLIFHPTDTNSHFPGTVRRVKQPFFSGGGQGSAFHIPHPESWAQS